LLFTWFSSSLAKLPIQEGQDLWQHLHDGDLDAGQVQGLAGLHTDPAPADHHCFPYIPLLPDAAQVIGILQAVQGGDPLQVRSRNGGHAEQGAGGQDELVVANGLGRAPVAAGHRVGPAVDRERLRAGQGFDPLGVQEEAGAPHHAGGGADQQLPIVEDARDVVGISARGHGEIGVFLDDGDLGLRIQSPGPGGGLRAGGGPPMTTILFGAVSAIASPSVRTASMIDDRYTFGKRSLRRPAGRNVVSGESGARPPGPPFRHGYSRTMAAPQRGQLTV
jgi:hypothetical protein